VIEHHKNFRNTSSLITNSLSILNGKYRASRMGANFGAFAFKKYERSEYTINVFAFDFALETTRAKRVP
jgi:hypothetical protein